MPTYPPYGKRILLDNGWFRTLTKPNVELVTDTIDHFAREGIVTADGKLRPADIIVISTGFKVTEMAARLNITGRGGKNLEAGLGQRQSDRLSRPHRAGFSELVRACSAPIRARRMAAA